MGVVPTDGISLDLSEDELAEDAVDAGLQGSFLRRRALSRPFSLGEGSGVPRGELGSWWEGGEASWSNIQRTLITRLS